jgi:hypothetical protein
VKFLFRKAFAQFCIKRSLKKFSIKLIRAASNWITLNADKNLCYFCSKSVTNIAIVSCDLINAFIVSSLLLLLFLFLHKESSSMSFIKNMAHDFLEPLLMLFAINAMVYYEINSTWSMVPHIIIVNLFGASCKSWKKCAKLWRCLIDWQAFYAISSINCIWFYL